MKHGRRIGGWMLVISLLLATGRSALAVNEVGDPNCAVVDVMQPNRLIDVDPGDRFWLTVPTDSGLAGVEVHRDGDKGWSWLKVGEFLLVQYDVPGEYTIRFRSARAARLAPFTVRVFAPPADVPPSHGHNGQAGAGGVQALGATGGGGFSLGSVYAGRYTQPGTTNLTDKYPLRVVADGPWSCTVWQYRGSWTNTYDPPAGTTGRWETADVVDVTNCVMWTLVKSCGGTQTLSTNNPSRLKVKDLILTNGPSYTPVGESVTNRTWELMVGDVATVAVVPGPFWVTNNPAAAASVFEWTTNGAAYTPFTGLSNVLSVAAGSNVVVVSCHSPSTSPTNQTTTIVGAGYVLSANTGDLNANGIPDFADGYTGVAWGTNAVAGLCFVPVTIDLGDMANNSTISFEYAGSSPRSVSQNTSCSGATIYQLPSDAGLLRLWAKDGHEPRDGSEVANGGDFVRGDSNAVNQSSLQISNGQLTLYAEGLRESSNTVLQVTYTDTNNVQVTQSIRFKVYQVQITLSPVGGQTVDPLMYPYHGLNEERVGRLLVVQPAAGLTAPIALQFIVTDDKGVPTNYPGMPRPILRNLGDGTMDTPVHDFNVSAVYSNVPPGSDLRIWVRGPVRGYFMAQQAGSYDFGSMAILPEPQLPSLSLGSKYRRVNRQGVALPDPSPTGEGEEDRLPDQAHIDMFNLTPTYSVSDARVPVVGGELTLEFRRTATLTSHELGGDTVPPYASENILGPGWSTSLGSRITVTGDAANGGLVTATVVDDLGNAYRYQWTNNSWQADVRHSFNNDALRATLTWQAGQLVLRRAFGTTLYYTAVVGNACASETYYRLEKVQDRNGNCLLYAYNAAVLGTTTTNALLVSSVTTSNGSTTPLSLSFAYTNTAVGVRLAKLTDPLGRVTTYDYANMGGDKLAQVTYPTVASGTPTVQFTYFDQSCVKTIYAGNVPLYANNSQQLRWVGVEKVTDARNGETTYTYANNFARMAVALRSDGTVLSMDRPYLTSVTTDSNKTATFHWDPNNTATNIINTVTDTRQKRTVYTFTGAIVPDSSNIIGQALRINTVTRHHVHAGNATVTWTYSNDRFDNLVGVTDLSTNTITYGYAGDQNKQYNLPSSRTNALGHTTTYEYSSAADGSYNKQSKVTDAENVVTEYQFDTKGNRTHVIKGNGTRTTTFAYNATGFLTSSTLTDLDGQRVTDYTPDTYGNVASTTNYTGYGRTGTALVTVTVRDAMGKVLSQTDPKGNVTTFGYDDLDRKTNETHAAVEHPNGSGFTTTSTAFHYDLNGNLTKVVDDNGQITLKEYDPLNRPTRTIVDLNGNGAADEGDLISRLVYDAVGNVVTNTDPNGNVTTFEYGSPETQWRNRAG